MKFVRLIATFALFACSGQAAWAQFWSSRPIADLLGDGAPDNSGLAPRRVRQLRIWLTQADALLEHGWRRILRFSQGLV